MPRDLAFEGQGQWQHADVEAHEQDLSLHPGNSNGLYAAGFHPRDDDEESEESNNEPGILDEVDAVGEAGEILAKLHPYGQVLTVLDVDSCVALEEAAFEEGHRASREKVGTLAIFTAAHASCLFRSTWKSWSRTVCYIY